MREAGKLVLTMMVCAGFFSSTAVAKQADAGGTAKVAPVPAAIFAAKRVFISNAGADSGLFPHPFSGLQDRGYNQFYGEMQGWGRYELVNEPDEADLVFEVQLVGPSGPANANKAKGASDPLPMLRLSVIQRQTHYVLWTLTETIEAANLQKTHDRNFDQAIAALAAALKALVSKTGV
ncbi:MAG: hypothetical protein ABLQ96_08680 [Candidatus Acidiferrum sp.]